MKLCVGLNENISQRWLNIWSLVVGGGWGDLGGLQEVHH